MQVTVVGAGIVGLAVACALREAGASVTCLDAAAPMSARSAGDTRIFRTAHGDAGLVREAMRARVLWDAWSARAGRRLVGPQGALVSGPRVAAWAAAMADGGAAHHVDEDGALHDPAGGVLDLAGAGRFLQDTVAPRRAGVVAVDGDGSVHLGDGTIAADAVVLAAGAGTPALAAPLGVAIPDGLEHHARFTFAGPADGPCHLDGRPDGSLASTYQHRTRSGRWAVGGHLPDDDTAWELGADEVARRSRAAVVDHVRRRLPHLDPEPVEELRCTPSRGLGDGIQRARSGAVHIVWGDNLAKMAPRIGESIADDVLGRPRAGSSRA